MAIKTASISIQPAEVQIVIPARNEEESIGRCLESLTGQQGIGFSITVVDDGSTDRTAALAQSFAGVRVIPAGGPLSGATGKCNALIRGAEGAEARWLLFTDADTFHHPGSLAGAVAEAERRSVDLLSYSPEQETGSLAELALMPVVFADLVRTYPPERVNNPSDPVVAANGQYILVRREVYEQLGGHRAVADKILEDVELARKFKATHHPIWFRQGAGLVRTRMYRSFRSMAEGWTKNLALLFRNPLRLAALRGLEFLFITGMIVTAIVNIIEGNYFVALGTGICGLLLYLLFLRLIMRAHFPWTANLMSFFGLPLFTALLLRSWVHSRVRGAVTWKGRTYRHSVTESATGSSIAKSSKQES
jgi:glycosyltransferase involved in cell wall biosynthesis